MATVVNARDVAIMATTPRTLSVSLPSNVVVPTGNVQGLVDIYDSTKQIVLNATSLLFQIPKSGATLPTSISMTAVLRNITGDVVFSVEAGTCSFTSNGNTLTILPAGLTTNSATIKASVIFNGVTYEDRVTIAKVAEGVDSVTGLLSNEACTISTGFDGTVSSFANVGGTFYVFDGINNKTGNAAVTYSVASSSGVTVSIAPTGIYTVTAMSDDNGTATLRAVYNGVTIDKVYTIAKSRAGADSQLVSLLTDSQVFKIAKDDTVTPPQITLTALANNLAGNPTFAITSGTGTLTGTGSSRIMTYSNMSTDAVTIQVTWDGKTDSITLVKVREGVDAVTGFLTNEASLVSADSAGTITTSLSTVGGTFKVFNGTTDVTGAAVTYSVASTSDMSATIASTGVYTITGLTADSGSVTFRAVYNDVTIDKVYSLTKSKAGSIGSNGTRGTVNIARAITGSAWLDSEALAAISNAGYGTPINRDIVTLYNTSASFSQSRFYDTATTSWLTLDAYVNGNMLVTGTISGSKLAANTITGDKIQGTTLSALKADLGTITAGDVHGATFHSGGYNSSYAWPAAGLYGFHLGPSGLLLGNANNGKYVQITYDGQFYAPGLSIVNGNATFSGTLSAATGTFSGSMTASAINAVNAINIGPNQVTIPASAKAGSSTSGYEAVRTTINSAGGQVFICAFAKKTSGQSTVAFDILRDATFGPTLISGTSLVSTGATTDPFISFMWVDQPGAGTHSYSVRTFSGGSAEVGMFVFECRLTGQ